MISAMTGNPLLDYKPELRVKVYSSQSRKFEFNVFSIIHLMTIKATSHSTIFGIPMRPLREDQKQRHRFTR